MVLYNVTHAPFNAAIKMEVTHKIMSLIKQKVTLNNMHNYKGGAHMQVHKHTFSLLTLRLLMSYIYGVPGKARNANVVYIWTYVWQC